MSFLGAGAAVVVLGALAVAAMGPPVINDVATDLQDPPQFSNPRLNPLPESFKEPIRSYYKDLHTLTVAGKEPHTVFAAAQQAASKMPRWSITSADASTGRLEGIATTAILRFKDDFVFRVKSDGAGNTLVDGRSKSRLGKGDFGANAARIQSFFKQLQAELQ